VLAAINFRICSNPFSIAKCMKSSSWISFRGRASLVSRMLGVHCSYVARGLTPNDLLDSTIA